MSRQPTPTHLAALLTTAAALVTALALAPRSAISQDTPCPPIPTVGNPDLHYLSGGTLRRPFVWRNPGNPSETRVWVAEDGGRIRYSVDGGDTFVIQQTPDLAGQMLLDIHFTDDGNTGWACGRGGRVLKTSNAGAQWDLLNPNEPELLAKDGNPGVFWGVRFLPDNQNIGWVGGLFSFFVTTDGGQSFEDVQIFRNPDDTVPLEPADFEFYALSIEGTLSGGFVGNAGAEWEDNLPLGVPAGEHLGVVFHTDSTDSRANFGRRWWITLETPEDELEEPWDFDFEDLDRGYMVGGSGNGNGSIYRTLNGGETWDGPEGIDPAASFNSFATLYGVADLGGDRAITSGYGGHIWLRQTNGLWIDKFASGYTAPLTGAKGIPGTDEAWVTGSFGFLRHTVDAGDNWISQNNGEYLLRGNDVHFLDRLNGVIVGQPDQVFRTQDGGCTFKKVYPSGAGFGPKPNLSGVAFANSQNGVAVGHQGNVVLTSDGGHSWSPLGVSGVATDMHLEDVIHVRGREYWAVGRQGPLNPANGQTAVVLRTMDDGLTWNPIAGLPETDEVQLRAITFVTLAEAFVVGLKGDEPRAFRYTSNGLPPWSNVSPPPDPAGKDRGLLAVAAGTSEGSRKVYAAGENGTFVVWDPDSLEFIGIDGVYEFLPDGTVTLQSEVHDFTAVGIASGIGHVLVGSNNNNHSGIENDTSTLHLVGTTLRFNGTAWTPIKSSTNKNIRAFSFVTTPEGVVGFMLGGGGPGGIDFGTLADTELTIYTPQNP